MRSRYLGVVEVPSRGSVLAVLIGVAINAAAGIVGALSGMWLLAGLAFGVALAGFVGLVALLIVLGREMRATAAVVREVEEWNRRARAELDGRR